MCYFPHQFGMFQGVIQNMVMNEETDKISINASIFLDNYLPSNVIDFNNLNSYWLSEDDPDFGQWLELELKDRWISLTKFSFHGGGGAPPLSFDFEAKENDKDWVTLYSQNNSDILLDGPKTLPISKKVVARKFRWINTGPCKHLFHQYSFRIAAVELFGAITKCSNQCTATIPFKKIPFIDLTYYKKIILFNYKLLLYCINILIFNK